ncbi:hypothetical protein LCGC14_1441830 [marine sediment metagenome]|uniref:Uncharacterized protein n=1 Tax=marine sediment metagenome TaxID=412755 RepID=A0A0F9JL48_9ZZZZ
MSPKEKISQFNIRITEVVKFNKEGIKGAEE